MCNCDGVARLAPGGVPGFSLPGCLTVVSDPAQVPAGGPGPISWLLLTFAASVRFEMPFPVTYVGF